MPHRKSKKYLGFTKRMRATRRKRRRMRSDHAKKQKNRCFYCNRHMWQPPDTGESGALCTLDRKIPGAKGGKYTKKNTCAACKSCNQAKGDKLLASAQAPFDPPVVNRSDSL